MSEKTTTELMQECELLKGRLERYNKEFGRLIRQHEFTEIGHFNSQQRSIWIQVYLLHLEKTQNHADACTGADIALANFMGRFIKTDRIPDAPDVSDDPETVS